MSLQIEIYRKFLHFLLIFIPVVFLVLGKFITILILAPITLFIVSLDYLRRKDVRIKMFFEKFFGAILRPHELAGDKLSGASFVFLAATINFFFFKPEIAVTGFLILAISDALASLIGKAYPSQPFFEKSLSGSAAFFISALIILVVCGIAFDSKIWFYLFGLFAVFCVTIIEARPSLLAIDDNLTIPLIFAIEMSFFDIIWNSVY